VGHEAGGQLAEAVRRRPYQVVLLDEVEKAHPEVLTTFLAVFDEGRLTDSRGRAVDFTNTVILMTSNLGAEHSAASSKRRVGFSSHDTGNEEVDNRVASAARAALAPELYNRIDEVLVFAALTRDDVREVARRMLNGIATALLAQRGVKLEFTASALETLLDAGGFDPSLGARPMRRTIARLVEAPLAESILRGQFAAGQRVRLSGVRGEIRIDVTEPERVAATL
jgi:ATP-dependent Clp protease ATP-binding subunit ClpC